MMAWLWGPSSASISSLPVMPRWMPRLALASEKSMRMNLPCRRTALIVFPAMRSGLPRIIRAHRNSAARMRRPASRGARPRTMVSTSGSSGILGNVDQDIVASDLCRERRDPDRGVVIVLARAAVELPGVPGAGEMGAVDGSLSQRSALMGAGSGERVYPSFDVANGVALFSERGFHHRPGGELRQGADFYECHVLIVARWRLA